MSQMHEIRRAIDEALLSLGNRFGLRITRVEVVWDSTKSVKLRYWARTRVDTDASPVPDIVEVCKDES